MTIPSFREGQTLDKAVRISKKTLQMSAEVAVGKRPAPSKGIEEKVMEIARKQKDREKRKEKEGAAT
jgi:hypothetical protein